MVGAVIDEVFHILGESLQIVQNDHVTRTNQIQEVLSCAASQFVQTHCHEVNVVFLLLLLLLNLLLLLIFFFVFFFFLFFSFPGMGKVNVLLVAIDVNHSPDRLPGLNKDLSVEHHLAQKPSFAQIAGAGDESGGSPRKNAELMGVSVISSFFLLCRWRHWCHGHCRRHCHQGWCNHGQWRPCWGVYLLLR